MLQALSETVQEKFGGKGSPVWVLLASALGVVLVFALAGVVVYTDTRGLIEAGDWVQHTQDVMLSLQRAGRWAERADYNAQLYVNGGSGETLRTAQTAVDQLHTAVVHVGVLVADNPQQVQYTRQLLACTNEIDKALDTLHDKAGLPTAEFEDCQRDISLMTEVEQRLLQERRNTRQQHSYTSVVAEMTFVVLALLALLVLFGFLLRDALERSRISRRMKLANEQLGASVEALKERASEAEELTVCRDELQLCLNLEQIFEATTRGVERLLPGTNGSLCMINASRNLVEVVASWGETMVDDFAPPESCCGLRSGYPRWREPGGSELHCTHFIDGQAPERYLCLPVVAHGNGLGMLYVECADEAMADRVKGRLDGLRQFVQLMGMSVAAMNLRMKLENQSIRDGLTGLFNRHFMQVALERELARTERRHDSLAVFMLDVDHFKKFNDAHGHGAGDSVLKAIAGAFRASIREEDIACRYGGEEFTIILPDITSDAAHDRAEAIRLAVERLRVPLEKNGFGEVTLSAGVAMYPSDGRNAESLLRRADQALYRAKRAGRNQVAMAEMAVPV